MSNSWKRLCPILLLCLSSTILMSNKSLDIKYEKTNIIVSKESKTIIHTTKVSHSMWLYEKKSSAERKLSKNLTEALSEYMGANLRITSGYRSNGWSRSKHRHGNAIDVKYDTQVVDYLLSPEGEKWLKNNNLSFFIEQKYSISLPKQYRKHFRVIKWATSLHLHIEVNDNSTHKYYQRSFNHSDADPQGLLQQASSAADSDTPIYLQGLTRE